MTKGNYFCDYLIKIGVLKEKIEIKEVKTDSKKIKSGDVFIAIYGGNNYVEEALERGASFVVSERKDLEDQRVLIVEDSVLFLQEFASYYRKRLNPTVFAITGSNGKTSVKDILYTILSAFMKGSKTIGNLNNHIGVPLTLMNIEDEDEFVVVEMGMSGFGEIDLLAKLAQPDYGIITNIGDSHLEQLGSREGVCKAKTELIKHVKKEIIVSGDDEYLKKEKVVKVGFGAGCSYKINKLVENEEGVKFDLNINEKKYEVKSNLLGKHNAYNLVLAIATAVEFGINVEKAIKVVRNVEISNMRMQKIKKDGTLYINDAYNASPVSMEAAIKTFSKLYNDTYKIAVIGDMLELGNDSKKFHENIGEYILKEDIDEIYLYGKEIRALYEKYRTNKIKYFESKDEIIEEINKITKEKTVLLKASRGMRLEEILK